MSREELADLIDAYLQYCQNIRVEEKPTLSGFADWLRTF